MGTWSVLVSDVTLTVAFTAGGDVETVQAAPLTGDLPDCMVELIGRGTYTVADGSVELDTPTARQRTTGCTAPDSDEPISATSLQNFADALSGPYVLTETTLQLGTSYPAFHRVAD